MDPWEVGVVDYDGAVDKIEQSISLCKRNEFLVEHYEVMFKSRSFFTDWKLAG